MDLKSRIGEWTCESPYSATLTEPEMLKIAVVSFSCSLVSLSVVRCLNSGKYFFHKIWKMFEYLKNF